MNKPKSENGIYALVTGASHGLGRSYAIELAVRGINTVLVALPGQGLEKVAEECRRFGVCSEFIETDLRIKENVIALARNASARFPLSILINNAGTGGSRSFLDCEPEYIDNIIQLNVAATALLTHQLLPALVRRRESYILNVSSMASLSPIGFKTVYPASKRFVQDFSRGLCEEMKGTGVHVGVVHPGPMATTFAVRRRIVSQGVVGRLWLMTPDHVARASLDRLFAKKKQIVIGFSSKLSKLLIHILPLGLRLSMMTRTVYKGEIAAGTVNRFDYDTRDRSQQPACRQCDPAAPRKRLFRQRVAAEGVRL